MRCSNCRKRINKKSSFCMACGEKVPRIPKPEKKKNRKKKRSVIKTAVSIIAVFLITLVSFAVFGDDIVPEKVRNLKAYSFVTAAVRDKVPDEIKLPFGLKVELPVDLPEFAVKLPFDLDERLSGLTKRLSGLPLLGFLGDGSDDLKDKRSSEEIGDANEEDAVILAVDGTESKTTVPRSEEEIKLISAGVDNGIILNNYNVFDDIPADWIRCNVQILEHRTDVEAGTDTVVIYLELENSYVNLAGTKEITYRYNEMTGNWEPGSESKISCLSAEPVTAEI